MAAEIHSNESEFTVHANTYHRFTLGVKWAAIYLASVIVFLIVGFATSAGFFGGLFVGIVVFLVGVFAMNHGLNHSTERDNPA
jgi:hypothetical protein